MKKIEILVYSKNSEILQTVLSLIHTNDAWQGEGVTEEEEVIEKCQRTPYELIILGGGIPSSSEKKVRAVIGKLYPDLKIIQHLGGGNGMISNEIQAALSGRESATFNILDNPFGS